MRLLQSGIQTTQTWTTAGMNEYHCTFQLIPNRLHEESKSRLDKKILCSTIGFGNEINGPRNGRAPPTGGSNNISFKLNHTVDYISGIWKPRLESSFIPMCCTSGFFEIRFVLGFFVPINVPSFSYGRLNTKSELPLSIKIRIKTCRLASIFIFLPTANTVSKTHHIRSVMFVACVLFP